jgi:hypothetical protein
VASAFPDIRLRVKNVGLTRFHLSCLIANMISVTYKSDAHTPSAGRGRPVVRGGYDAHHDEVLSMTDAVDVTVGVAELTTGQRAVLQAVYDYFRAHGTWPKFITIDRPLRRAHRWDTAAIVQSLPASLIVPPRHGDLRPTADDELRLRLSGIEVCAGGLEDTERFVRLLRWLAEREETYEPEPGSDEEMPLVTSEEVAAYLGLAPDDRLPLQRLLAMLRLDHWGLSGTSAKPDGWTVRLGEDIWRFRDVRTASDCMAAREAWISEGRPAIPETSGDVPQAAYYHVRLSNSGQSTKEHARYDLSAETLESQVLAPYREGRAIMTGGVIIRAEDIGQIRVVQTDRPYGDLRQRSRSLISTFIDAASGDWSTVARYGTDVTDQLVTEPPYQHSAPADGPNTPITITAVAPLYVDRQVTDAIRAKAGQSTFEVAKLLGLIDELNDNYSRRNTYASHALLRAILDHVPPILGCANFAAVADNYAWPQTDKKYLKRLADFRTQADDALHRQISAKPNLLGFDDMPTGVHVDILLQECVERL